MATKSCLYVGKVIHARAEAPKNVFSYNAYWCSLDLDELPQLDREIRGFGVDRMAPLSFRSRDHFDGQRVDLRDVVTEKLREHGTPIPDNARIQVLTNLRTLGYVFNPICVYWIFDPDSGEPIAHLAEVSSTFGERVAYPLSGPDAESARSGWWGYRAEKKLHVSPFLDMHREYRFRFSSLDERLHVGIGVEGGPRPFHASIEARRVPLTTRSLWWAQIRYPMTSVVTMARIHGQAVRLWRRGAQFYSKPPFTPHVGTKKDVQ